MSLTIRCSSSNSFCTLTIARRVSLHTFNSGLQRCTSDRNATWAACKTRSLPGKSPQKCKLLPSNNRNSPVSNAC